MRKIAGILIGLAVGILFLWPSEVYSMQIMGPKSSGMAETNRGICTGNDSIYINPAGMSLFPRYVVESFWRRHTGRNETLFSLSVLDSSTGPVAAGLSYTYDYAGRDGGIRSGSRLDLSSSYRISPWFLAGTTFRYLHYNTEDGPIKRMTGDAGILVRLGERLNLGIVGHNIINPSDRGDAAPRYFGAGLGLIPFTNTLVGVDYTIDPDFPGRPSRYSAGAEISLFGHFGFRGGWIFDEYRDESRFNLGATYFDDTYGLDFAYGRSLSDSPGYEIGLGIRFFVR